MKTNITKKQLKKNHSLVEKMRDLATKSTDYEYSVVELENIMNVGRRAFDVLINTWSGGDKYNDEWYSAFQHGIHVAMWQYCDDDEHLDELRNSFEFAKHAWTNPNEKMWKEEEE
jgi:hypothetical protein